MPLAPRVQALKALTAIAAIALLAVLNAAPALSQGVTATATPAGAARPVDNSALNKRVDELEGRVQVLEKEKAQLVALDNASAQKLEQRLAAVETALRRDGSESTSPRNVPTSAVTQASTVRAPFVVLDESGKPLFRVDRSPKGSARATVGEPSGARAWMTVTSSQEVQIGIADSSDQSRFVVNVNGPGKGASLKIGTRTGGVFVGHGEDEIPKVQVINKSGWPVAELWQSESQAGRLTLANAGGSRILDAGETTQGVGIIKMGPGGNGAAAVQGNIALPASSIQGKK